MYLLEVSTFVIYYIGSQSPKKFFLLVFFFFFKFVPLKISVEFWNMDWVKNPKYAGEGGGVQLFTSKSTCTLIINASRNFPREGLNAKSWAQRRKNFEKMVMVFSDLSIKFGVNVTKLSIFFSLRGGGGYNHGSSLFLGTLDTPFFQSIG